jgi:hypothetical protein
MADTALVNRLTLSRASLQLLYRRQDAAPEHRAAWIAVFAQLIGALSRPNCGIVAVLVNHQLGAA